MERYKKRTIALSLASLLTVVGAFGAANYSNTLMDLKINVGSGGYVNVTAFTKKPYKIPLKTAKIDENTFVITLNNTNSEASSPNIENYENIESIKISTYPYTTEAEGCTRIFVKTKGEPILSAGHALFLTDKLSSDDEEDEETENNTDNVQNNNSEYNANTYDETKKVKNTYTASNNSANVPIGSTEYMMIFLCISVLLMIIVFIYKISKNKMASVIGDNNDFDIDDIKTDNKQSKAKTIKTTINKLDKVYSDNNIVSDFTYNKTDNSAAVNDTTDSSNENEEQVQNIVDLDALFNESQKNSSESVNENEIDNDDLADLLNSFVFEPAEQEKEPEEEPFDEELYKKIINSDINFSNSDTKKINDLMQVELTQEAITELNKYLNTPVKKSPTQDQILAELVSTYSIDRNISFSHEDISAIRKLMNVELGPDFTKDFTTNPARTKIVEKEIRENKGKPHKTSEIITLKVKDLLPDLSKELAKQGGKSIKSEAKPTVVYFSEGYEYKTLHVSNDLSNISANTTQNEHKPSYEAPIVASGYEVSTLSIKDELPDLNDVKANPKKYETKIPETKKADENALLKSLANVTFKPFYEEVENEMNQFDNFEIVNPDEKDIQTEKFDYHIEPDLPEPDLPAPNSNIKKERNNDDNAKKLLLLIEAQQTEREHKKQNSEESAAFKKELESTIIKKKKQITDLPTPFDYNGEKANILKTVKCTKNSECKIILAGDKYIILGNIDNKEIVLKEYTDLNSSEMFIRLNDKSDKTRFLVKVGKHKFIIRITEDNMEFLMDLC